MPRLERHRELKNVAGVERVRNKPREHTIPVEYIEDVQMTFGCHINPFLPNATFLYPLKTSKTLRLYDVLGCRKRVR